MSGWGASPWPVDNPGWVAAAGLIGFHGNEAVALSRIREGRAIGSAALVADSYHACIDGLTSLAVLVGAGAPSHAAAQISALAIGDRGSRVGVRRR